MILSDAELHACQDSPPFQGGAGGGANPPPSPQFITIVSGLPRSGTSMMMNILAAGGMNILTDNARIPDEDNPRGYYELEKVKALKDGENEWLSEAQGKAVKIISALLHHLPSQYQYKIIFMRRDLDEILASQNQMLVRRDEPTDKIDDYTLGGLFQKHLTQVEKWLSEQPNIGVTYVNYNDILQNPERDIQKVVQFLDLSLDKCLMLGVPEKNLYRQRG
ncbi:sulfotransferase [Chloroflexota bacterium]